MPDKSMDRRERAIRARLRDDYPHYAARCLKIRTKGGGIEPFILNAAQKHVHAALEAQRRETGGVRAVILKGRQQGCSTYVGGRFYWRVTHGQGRRAFVMTHLDDATKNLFQIVQRFHEHCPEAVKPDVAQANMRELVFGRLESSFQVGTARSLGVGRSNTIQFFHGSEVAFWPRADEHMAGILQAVPDAPGTEVILESTSGGPEGHFHMLCQEARAGQSAYRFIFVPWFWQDEYRKAPPEGFAPTAEEEEYKRIYGLDDAQLFWRRSKIRDLGGIWTFRREYPSTPDEAFHADDPFALWNRDMIEKARWRAALPPLVRVVVAVDPP